MQDKDVWEDVVTLHDMHGQPYKALVRTFWERRDNGWHRTGYDVTLLVETAK